MEKFLLGFIAGEGSFHLPINHKSNGNVRIFPAFSLRVYETEILEKIHEELSIGEISQRQEGLQWQVQSLSDCIELRSLVEYHSDEWFKSTHKYEQFSSWCNAIDMIESKDNLTKDDKKRLIDISFSIAKTTTRKIDKQTWYNRIDNFEQYYCVGENKNGERCKRYVNSKGETCPWH